MGEPEYSHLGVTLMLTARLEADFNRQVVSTHLTLNRWLEKWEPIVMVQVRVLLLNSMFILATVLRGVTRKGTEL